MPINPLVARCERRLRAFRQARRGGVAVLTAIVLVPIMIASCGAIDLARLSIVRASLQATCDGAALAGATALDEGNGTSQAVTIATDYYNKESVPMAATAAVSAPTVSMPTSVRVEVAATATLNLTLTGILTGPLTASIVAIAQAPGYVLQATNGKSSSSAYDSNSIYFYVVSSNGSVPTSVSQMTLIYTNDPSVNSAAAKSGNPVNSVAVGPNDLVGFALVNKTGGLTGYGSNQYGSAQGNTNIFYSSLPAPSQDAYPKGYTYDVGTMKTYNNREYCTNESPITSTTSGGQNSGYVVRTNSTACSAYPCVTFVNGTSFQNNLLIGGSCSTPSTAIQTCAQLNSNPITMDWNDMGGGSDDYDYNDEEYTVSCSPTSSTSATANNASQVILVQ